MKTPVPADRGPAPTHHGWEPERSATPPARSGLAGRDRFRVLTLQVIAVLGGLCALLLVISGGAHAAAILAGGAAAAGLLILGLRRTLRAPMQELEESVRRMRHGDLETAIATGDASLLQPLAEGLEAMRKNLEATTRRGREQNERLLHLDAIKQHFLITMSHEVRTPMNGIIGFLQLLMDSGLRPDQVELAETSLGSARSLLLLLGDILDFTQIQAGELVLETRPTSVRACLDDAAAFASREAKKKGLDLEVHLDDTVPAALMLDESKVRKVLSHLVNNAVKFTDNGSVGLRASARVRGEGVHRLRLEVTDTGPGIEAKTLPMVFDAFTQGDSSHRRSHSGTGIGLAICRSLIDLMGGEIGVESAPGVGSSFWITLDVVAVDMGRSLEIPQTSSTRAPTKGAGRRSTLAAAAAETTAEFKVTGRPRVLIVEDNPVNQRLTSRILERLGYEVAVASHGAEALETLDAEEEPFDVVLMDCQMPVMDGYEATRAIRSREDAVAGTPVIALTANNLEGARDECMKAGMDDYLTKPLQIGPLKTTLRRWADAGTRPRPAAL